MSPVAVCPQHATVPVVLIPQAKPLPALTWVKVPEATLVVVPVDVLPQHFAVPAVLIPQANRYAALTWVKVPEATLVVVPVDVSPQHLTFPAVLIPQANVSPALTWVKVVPEGGLVSPVDVCPQQIAFPADTSTQASVLPALTWVTAVMEDSVVFVVVLPQHVAVPCSTPQAKPVPALIRVKVPEGGLVSPVVVWPQHFACPVDLIPQAKSLPALTWVKVPEGGLVSPVVVRPQHVACPVVLIPQANVPPALIEPTPGTAGAAVSGATLAVGAAEAAPAVNTVPAVASERARAPVPVRSARQERWWPRLLDSAVIAETPFIFQRWGDMLLLSEKTGRSCVAHVQGWAFPNGPTAHSTRHKRRVPPIASRCRGNIHALDPANPVRARDRRIGCLAASWGTVAPDNLARPLTGVPEPRTTRAPRAAGRRRWGRV